MIDYSKIENIPVFTKLDTVFGNVEMMPPYEEIPAEFKSPYNKWCKLFGKLFYKGSAGIYFSKKKNVSVEDFNRVAIFIQSIMASFAPKHEHKESAVAYLFSLYLDDWKDTTLED